MSFAKEIPGGLFLIAFAVWLGLIHSGNLK
jgi:hypothetical protein